MNMNTNIYIGESMWINSKCNFNQSKTNAKARHWHIAKANYIKFKSKSMVFIYPSASQLFADIYPQFIQTAYLGADVDTKAQNTLYIKMPQTNQTVAHKLLSTSTAQNILNVATN